MGKLIQTKFNPTTQKLEVISKEDGEVKINNEPVSSNEKAAFIVEEAFDVHFEKGEYHVPVTAYKVGEEDRGLFHLEVSYPFEVLAKGVKKGSTIYFEI